MLCVPCALRIVIWLVGWYVRSLLSLCVLFVCRLDCVVWFVCIVGWCFGWLVDVLVCCSVC